MQIPLVHLIYIFFLCIIFIFSSFFVGTQASSPYVLHAWKKMKIITYIVYLKAYTILLEKPLCWSLYTSLCRRIYLLPYFNPSLYNGIIFFIHTVFIVQQDAKQNFTLLMCEIVELQNIKTKTSKSKHMNPPFVVYMMLKLPVVLLTWSPALSSDIGWSFDNGCILP
jgi:hypothetical protein